MTEHTSRRRFLKAAAATGALAGLNATVLAQDGGAGEQLVVLDGLTPGWLAYRLPGGAEATGTDQNPALSLQEGTTYTLVWVNGDGQPHNFAIQDEQGENLEVLRPLGIDRDTYQQINGTGANESVSLDVSEGNVTGVSAGNESGGMAGNGTTVGGDGELVAQTEIISEEGAVQAVQFTASAEMASYICLVHPNTMVGDVTVESGGGAGNDSS
ncbi:twin-arginine translocation signal domain-containing protein [Halorussus halobius]|uniref:twin-arginine translocation signal domain-containing protein n=1 Tax=Halorussus halobius TaxID=1710537 RepID=UPI0010924246|nr:twin-arginine translocation signal domain-containing protein [Halorussus halobius]